MSAEGLKEFILRRREQIRSEGTPLWKRRAEIADQLKEVDAKIAELTTEWEDLKKAGTAINLPPHAESEPKPTEVAEATPVRQPLLTIKEAILKVLEAKPEGMPSPEILDAINTQFFNGSIVRTSFSPQLSRLKADGEIIYNGSNYLLNQTKVSELGASLFERRTLR